MLKVIECLDIALIGRLRQACLGRPMDSRDNFSWHAVLTDDDRPAGVGRLYREGKDLVIDCVAVEAGSPPNYFDLLFRSLLFKALSLPAESIRAVGERGDGYYAAFGFRQEGKDWIVAPQEAVFPSACRGCPTPCGGGECPEAPGKEK